MQGWPLAEGAIELPGVHAGDRRRVEGADAALKLEWAREGLLDGHLLIEDEADEERERLFGEEGVGLVVAGEMEAGGGLCRYASILARGAFCAYLLFSVAMRPSVASESLIRWGWEEG